jgi:hypothetical protein
VYGLRRNPHSFFARVRSAAKSVHEGQPVRPTPAKTAVQSEAGHLLQEQYSQESAYLNPVSNVVLGLIALGYLYRVIGLLPDPSCSSY